MHVGTQFIGEFTISSRGNLWENW